MATLYITEFTDLSVSFVRGNLAQVAAQPPNAEQTPLAISGTAALSAAFAANTTLVRLHTDSICSVLFGSAPTATTANARMTAGQTEYFGVAPGMKVSVIANT